MKMLVCNETMDKQMNDAKLWVLRGAYDKFPDFFIDSIHIKL